VTGEPIGTISGFGPGRIGANVRTALFFGHRHADRHAGLLPGRAGRGVIARGRDPGYPFAADFGIEAERRDRGISHGHRTAGSSLGLAQKKAQGGVERVSGLGSVPRRSGDALVESQCHQLVIGGMELHLVDPMTEAVMGFKNGRVPVRSFSPAYHFARAGTLSETAQPVEMASRPGHCHRVAQRAVRAKTVESFQRRRLVGYFMRIESFDGTEDFHDRFLLGAGAVLRQLIITNAMPARPSARAAIRLYAPPA